MSITANAIISFDENALSTIEVYDASTYTSPSVVTDVTAVRIMFATVNSVNAAGTVSSLKAWTEYTADQTVVINGLPISYGDTIYLANDYNLPTGYTATETGFYGERSTWLPSDATYTFFTPSQCYNTNSLVFADNVFTMRYELYTTKVMSGMDIEEDGYYIVSGDADSYIVVDDAYTAKSGEVVYLTSYTPVAYFNDAFISKREVSTNLYFCTTGQAFEVLQSYIKAVANNMNAPQEVKNDLLKIIANYNVIDFTAAQQYGFDLQYMQNLLDEIQEYYAELPWQ